MTRKWQDKEGKNQYTTEIIAYDMQMLDRKGQSDASDLSISNLPGTVPALREFDDEIFFDVYEKL